MPYLTFIGPHAGARYNASGFASRGYWLFRHGSDVITRWGAVEVIKGSGNFVRWRERWHEKVHRCSDASAAKQLLVERLYDFQLPSHGYKRLRRGSKIAPAPHAVRG